MRRHAAVHSIAEPPSLPPVRGGGGVHAEELKRHHQPQAYLPSNNDKGTAQPPPARFNGLAAAGERAPGAAAASAAAPSQAAAGPGGWGWQVVGSLLHDRGDQQRSAAWPSSSHSAACVAEAELDAVDAATALEAAGRLVAELHAAARSTSRSSGGGAPAAAAATRWASSVELLRPQLTALQPDQMADLAWALSRLGIRPGSAWLLDLCAAASAKFALRRFRGYTFATLLPALCALRAAPGAAWVGGCLRAMAPKLGAMWPRELASIAAAVSCLLRGTRQPAAAAQQQLTSSGWAEAFFESSLRQLDRFEPVGLARSVHAVAQLSAEWHAAVPAEWLEGVVVRLRVAAEERRLQPQEVAMTLQALSLLQHHHHHHQQQHTREQQMRLDALQMQLEHLVSAGADVFGPQELSTALLGIANLGRRPDWLWLHQVLTAAQVRRGVVD